MRFLIVAAVGISLVVAIAGTVIGGRYCTVPDNEYDGCADRIPDEERAQVDADRYGWPVAWRTDMSETRFELEGTGIWLTDRWGVSWVLLFASLVVWFGIAFVPLGGALMLYRRWRRTRRRGPVEARI